MKPSFRTSVLTASLLATAVAAPAFAQTAETISPKVMVITMFGEEAKPWLTERKLDTKTAVPGFSKVYPEVACDAGGSCMMTTATGFANAASTVSALG